MNKFIREVIIPHQEKKKEKGSPTLDLSHCSIADHVEAVVKYFRLKNKKNLILQGCNLTDKIVFDLIGPLLNMQNFDIDCLDLSLNRLTDEGCKHLGEMLQTDKKLKKLDIGRNIQITQEGFKLLVKSVRKNTHIQEIEC